MGGNTSFPGRKDSFAAGDLRRYWKTFPSPKAYPDTHHRCGYKEINDIFPNEKDPGHRSGIVRYTAFDIQTK
jgi:hypothetical protein